MPYKTEYKKGTHNVICDICGFQMKSDEVKLNWKNQLVCLADFEPKHPNLEVPEHPRKEGINQGILQGETEDTFRTVGDVTDTSTDLMQGGS